MIHSKKNSNSSKIKPSTKLIPQNSYGRVLYKEEKVAYWSLPVNQTWEIPREDLEPVDFQDRPVVIMKVSENVYTVECFLFPQLIFLTSFLLLVLETDFLYLHQFLFLSVQFLEVS